MKHIVFINRSYWPDVEATGQLLTELAEDLASQFRVSVICGQPMANPERAEFARGGTAIRNGVEIRRVRHTRFPKKSFLGRIANMVSFLAAASWRALTLPRFDIVVVETDPPLLCLLGRALQLLRRARLVCYLQDIYPDVAVALGKLRDGWMTRTLGWWFYGIYRRADRVVVLSRDMREHLLARGVAADRVHCIANWIDTRQIRPLGRPNPFREAQGYGDKFVVMYSGNLGLSQRLEELIAAAERLRQQADIQFILIGDGANRAALEQLAAARRLPNVRFADYQPKSRLAESLSAADLHVVFLDPRITHCLMPSKIYGILAAGVPVLLLAAPHSELAELVLEHRLGRVVAGDDAAAIAAAVLELAADPEFRRNAGERARRLAVARYDRHVSVAEFRGLLEAVGEDRGAVRPAPASPLARGQSPGGPGSRTAAETSERHASATE